MIKLNGEIGFTLGFEIEVDMTEEQWHSLSEREQMEIVCEHFDRYDYNNMEAVGIDIWDLEEVEQEESA